ncbi:uncharacterized protein LOC126902673 isoform X2 [Daktulosphaira vitifoliae]|uniref:uncharacterized protein LOC126902673 isoform X2 n=1 Tax=Daktulosphaira vitifoliae TaxID=58002 RepID=UPI0021A9B09F|nr:uncharacterized protein LOC126902673 isoform X2 [Daktulosphaira vitifoliae]
MSHSPISKTTFYLIFFKDINITVFLVVIVFMMDSNQNLNSKKLEKTISVCNICALDEEQTVTFLPCKHKIGNFCANTLKLYYGSDVKCPWCKEYVVEYVNMVENKICYICQEEELKVKFLSCKHQIGNNCANRLYKLKHLDCPFCLLSINIFRGIHQEMNCICEMEKNSITLKPCNHRLGYICANTLKSWYIRTQKCPTCQSDIKSYEDDTNKTPSIFQKSYSRLKSFSKIGECVNNILDNHLDKSIELYYE